MTEDAGARRARHFDYLKNTIDSKATSPRGEVPPPPYHVRDAEAVFAMCTFSEEAIAGLLPSSLQPSDSRTGVFGIYSVERGWGIAAFSACYVALEVKGMDSPDGSPGVYIHHGFFSGMAGTAFHNLYNTNAVAGSSRQYAEGDLLVGEAMQGDAPILRMKIRPIQGYVQQFNAINRNLGLAADGQVTSCLVALSATYSSAELVSLDIFDTAPAKLRGLRPETVIWCVRMTDMAVTFGAARTANESESSLASDASGIDLLALFSRLGRPSLIVGAGGRVLQINAMAEKMMSERGFADPDQWLRSSELRAMIEASSDRASGQVSEPLVVNIGEDQRPVLVQVLALDSSVTGKGARMISIVDPTGPNYADPIPTLRLLGLTQAEARIAAAIGGGLSPKETAERLAISENTVRSTLKLVFEKLGVSRQNELAAIVTKLEFVLR